MKTISRPGSQLSLPITLVSGKTALAEKIRERFRFPQGAWILDVRQGYRWHDVLGKSENYRTALGLVRRILQTCPGVSRIDALTLVVGADRQARVVYTVVADDGDTVSDEAFLVQARN